MRQGVSEEGERREKWEEKGGKEERERRVIEKYRDVGGGRQRRKKIEKGRRWMEGRRKQWAKLHYYKDY